jgi:cytochrome c peroxidase
MRLTCKRLLPAVLMLSLPLGSVHAQPPPPPPLQPLPPPPQPPGNPVTAAKANLGKALFWDEQLSSTRTMACGTCHQATSGGSDRRSTMASAHADNPGLDGLPRTPDDITGSPGVVQNQANGAMVWSPTFGLAEQVTGRHAPSYVNAAYAPVLFWDGRAGGTFVDPVTGQTVLQNGAALETQSTGPPVSSGEMGHLGRDWTDVATRVSQSVPLALSVLMPPDLAAWIGNRDYGALFQEAFGSAGVTASRIAMAIASYERTLFSVQTPFDSVIAGTAQLTPQEAAGMQLFGQVGCARCHAGALMSDNQFHYIGVRPAAEDSGRMVVTHNLQDLGAMRTPSLRNVALRPVYFHDGRFAMLSDVIDFYDRGGDFTAPNKDPRIVPLNLTPQQKAALLAFLGRPLIDRRVASATFPFDRPTLYTETALVPQVLAGGAGGVGGVPQPVALEPALAGNARFTVGVTGGTTGAEAVLVVDAAEPPLGAGIPAAGSFARQSIVLESGSTGAGYGSVTLAIPDDPALYGRVLYGRWYVSDLGAPGGVAASPAFRFQIFGAHGAGVPLAGVGTPRAGDGTSRLQASQPNPFATRTLVRFDLFRPAGVRLAVFDVAGRVVRHLYERASASSGAYAVTWDGRDDSGRAVEGGLYFYRLETGNDTHTVRVVRVQ